jgi:hypothetical protein
MPAADLLHGEACRLARRTGLDIFLLPVHQQMNRLRDAYRAQQRRHHQEHQGCLVAQNSHHPQRHDQPQYHDRHRHDQSDQLAAKQNPAEDRRNSQRQQREIGEIRHHDFVVGRVHRHIARVHELDTGEFRPRENFVDRGVRRLRIQIRQSVAAVRIDAQFFDRIGAGQRHFRHDRAPLRVLADQRAHIQRLVHRDRTQVTHIVGVVGLVAEPMDDDVVAPGFNHLHIGETGDLAHERHFHFDRARQFVDLLHQRKIEHAVGIVHALVDEVTDLVGIELLHERLVVLERRVGGIEVGIQTVIRRDAQNTEPQCERQKQKARDDPAGVSNRPMGQLRKHPV